MVAGLKKVSSYVKKLVRNGIKLLKHGQPKEIAEILKQVEYSYILPALVARLNQNCYHVKLKQELCTQEINLYLDLLKHYRRKRLKGNLYSWEMNGKSIFANFMQFLHLRTEYFNDNLQRHYAFDWKGKRVLDIGGFVGDSALYFLENGASQVIVYEPVLENMQALRYNLHPYSNQVDLYQQAVSNTDGFITLTSNEPTGSLGFGLEPGKYSIHCEAITFTTLLLKHHVDAAKIDCEGFEKYLCDVKNDLIQTVPYWIVETHNPAIYQSILHKFHHSGFKKVKDLNIALDINLLHFQL